MRRWLVVLEVPRNHIEQVLNQQYEDGWVYYGPITGRQGTNEVDLVFRRDDEEETNGT